MFIKKSTKRLIKMSSKILGNAAKLLTVAALLLSACLAESNSLQVPGYNIATVGGQQQLPRLCSCAWNPDGLTFDSGGNMYVVLDTSVVVKVTPTGVSSVVAGGEKNTSLGDGGPATSATLKDATGIAVDAEGNLYIADYGNNRVRKVDTRGNISTFAGPGTGTEDGPLGDGGQATSATVYEPVGIAVDPFGNIFVAQPRNNRVREISNGIITTVAGNGLTVPNGQSGVCDCGDGGLATNAALPVPSVIATDSAGNLYIGTLGRVRKVTMAAGTITTLVGDGNNTSYGDGGLAVSAGIADLTGIAVDASGNVYIAEDRGNRVRVIGTDGNINTIAGGGTTPFSSADQGLPATSVGLGVMELGLAIGSDGSVYFCAQSGGPYLFELRPSSARVLPLPSAVRVNSAAAFLGVQSSGMPSGSFVAGSVALGGWMEIHGSYLAPDARSWDGADFNGTNAPMTLDGTSVTIGGQPAFVSYISAAQINVQVPSSIGAGSQPLVIANSNGKSPTYAVVVNPEQPALLSTPAFDINGQQYAVALFSDNATYVLPAGAISGVPSRPARTGDTITLYGVGFGTTSPGIPAGQIAGGTNSLTLPLAITISGENASVSYAGLAPGLVGLYQFNVVVPAIPQGQSVAVVEFSLGTNSNAGQVGLSLAVQ